MFQIAGINAKSTNTNTFRKTLLTNTVEEFMLLNHALYNKRSVVRSQSRDTNRNIKRLVYCQYG